jgi:retinol dehydrogenase 14
LHPGLTATGIVDDVAPRALVPTVGFIKLFLRSPAAGAKTTLLLATSPELGGISGQYFRNGKPATSGVHTYDREFQEEIWRVSNELVGLDELAPSF